jgi:hypothetical protein
MWCLKDKNYFIFNDSFKSFERGLEAAEFLLDISSELLNDEGGIKLEKLQFEPFLIHYYLFVLLVVLK